MSTRNLGYGIPLKERKEWIENAFLWEPRIYMGATMRGSRDISEIANKADAWLKRVASYNDCHATMDCVVEENHFHAVVLADKPITTRLAKSLWHDGFGSFRIYDSTKGGVIYNHDGHHVALHSLECVACHRNRSSCKRGRCPYQTGKVSILK